MRMKKSITLDNFLPAQGSVLLYESVFSPLFAVVFQRTGFGLKRLT